MRPTSPAMLPRANSTHAANAADAHSGRIVAHASEALGSYFSGIMVAPRIAAPKPIARAANWQSPVTKRMGWVGECGAEGTRRVPVRCTALSGGESRA